MKHKCVRCETLYEEGDSVLLNGCSCGSKVFVLLGEGQEDLNADLRWIENELVSVVKATGKPITLDVENIRVLEKGVFELDVASIAKNPLVVRDEQGVYYIKINK